MDLGEFYKQTTLPNLTKDLPKDIPIPKKIGPYPIDALLSRGGMSLLYLGAHPDTHQPLVIKVLSPYFVKNQEMVNQFLREAKIIEMSDHPNIVKLYGQGEWEEGLYIAMEFIQGVSLKQFILQHSLSLKRSLEVLLQVAYALLHLHTHGVIHRDLKPENILITEEGGVKVIDFGIAQLAQDSEKTLKTSKGGLIGTPSYMSPEQKKDPLHVSYSADIFALGIISYELIVGRLSFGKLHLSYLPQSLQPIIQKAVAPSIEERYEDIVEYINALSAELRSMRLLDVGAKEHKELLAKLDELQKSLLPEFFQTPNDIEIHLAKTKGDFDFDLYYEPFRFASGNYLFIVAKSSSSNLDAIAHLAILKGLMYGLLSPYMSDDTLTFNLIDFTTLLNEQICRLGKKATFSFSALYFEERFSRYVYVACGLAPLIHYSEKHESVRRIASENPLLGASLSLNPFETFDHWEEGDTLILHTFETLPETAEEQLKAAFKENKEYPPQTIINTLLDDLAISGQSLALFLIGKIE